MKCCNATRFGLVGNCELRPIPHLKVHQSWPRAGAPTRPIQHVLTRVLINVSLSCNRHRFEDRQTQLTASRATPSVHLTSPRCQIDPQQSYCDGIHNLFHFLLVFGLYLLSYHVDVFVLFFYFFCLIVY